ncbi:PREDICTED: uncharacterized protein LOC108661565 [Theobroma cacao]|uniref:Uncharacterized protein LOC108661565 n=1 Tax=Theobroma cacao TaxID=3641 RepID=A0AB32W923_THECC|nr:PREDICTED: uncharacterized protein LOC108661565 [Theobroma cacao]
MRVFKWSPNFEAEKESSIVPIWISFPNLKAHLYEKSTLLLIAKTMGKPLFIDEVTDNGSRPSVARVCVEYYCKNAPVEEVWIVIKYQVTRAIIRGYAQRVEFSKRLDYCEHYCHVGHLTSTCLVLGNRLENLRKPPGNKTLRDDGKELQKRDANLLQKEAKRTKPLMEV